MPNYADLPGSPLSCRPAWASAFYTGRGVPANSLRSHVVGMDIDQDPETMRADAEATLNASGYFSGDLDIDVYSLARNVESEVGSGSPEEKVGVGLASKRRAKLRGQSVTSLVLAGRGTYGEINVPGTSQSAGSGRWTSSSREPNVDDIMIASAILGSNNLDDFVRGGDDQYGLDVSPSGAASSVRYMINQRKYWIGPVAGINPWHTFITVDRPDIDPNSTEGQDYLQAHLNAVATDSAGWQAVMDSLPACSTTLPVLSSIGFVGAAAFGVLYLFDRFKGKLGVDDV